MPRVSSLEPILRDSVDDSDLFILFDVSSQQDEPLHKITALELANALEATGVFDDSELDTLHIVTSRGNTTTNDITVNNATINGDLTVQGTTTTVNSTEMTIDDINITVGDGAADSAAANGGGLTLDGANAWMKYNAPSNCWEFNKTLCYPGKLETTDDLPEGDSNLYYTQTLVDSSIDSALDHAFSVQLIIYDSANTALKEIWGSPTGTY